MGTNRPDDCHELPEFNGSVRLVRVPDRRTAPDRRVASRGGRRATDRSARPRTAMDVVPHLTHVLSVKRWFARWLD